MKSLFTTLLLVLGLTAYGQTTITLTEDLVLTETLVIEVATNYVGNGFAIRCDGCNPAVFVKKDIPVNFDNVRFPKTYASWLRVEGGDMSLVTWDNILMRGSIESSSAGGGE